VDYKSLLKDSDKTKVQEICLAPVSQLTALKNQISNIKVNTNRPEIDFLHVLNDRFHQSPNEVAMRSENGETTYKKLHSFSTSIAKAITHLGIESKGKIVIFLPRSEHLISSILASLISGHCFIPVPYSHPKERLKFIIENVGADIIISDTNNLEVDIPSINVNQLEINENIEFEFKTPDIFYILYTSGSTGKPKGVPISTDSISNYLNVSKDLYLPAGTAFHMPFYTSIGFDLTMTSILLPLYTGGSIFIYSEIDGLDLAVQEVVENQNINCFKSTPSHLKLIEGRDPSSNIKSIIVGGENFTRDLAEKTFTTFKRGVEIYNEYGPTEATIGCIVHQYDETKDKHHLNIPIGKPIKNSFAFVANSKGIPVPNGVVGELLLGGVGLAKKYISDEVLSSKKFISGNSIIQESYYKTGDFARVNELGIIEYLGREDEQVKIGGIRIETGEVSNTLEQLEGISECIVASSSESKAPVLDYTYCQKCGLPSNYPTADFDEHGVCGYCQSFEGYKNKVQKYFKTESDFQQLFASKEGHAGSHDCIMLYSGGKDSTYALGKLVEMGLKVLAFTLDNGYIPDSAKENITRVTTKLGVDHVFETTPAMNEIFVDSLKTHCNVCNGCFKTIYNLSLKLAYQKGIPFLVTGLSRGQFFETKLSEEIFWKPMHDVKEIEDTLFQARKAYHSVRDAVYHKTDGQFIEEHDILQKVQIIDFYRYHDITLEQLLEYINEELPWVRPEDTGRSTNCTINKVGIYIHKKQKCYSNYAFPYSWDVRTGHKTKEETIDEIEEFINEQEVNEIISEIGFIEEVQRNHLVAYYSGNKLDPSEIKNFASDHLPQYMIPASYVHLEQIPLTANGKIDFKLLPEINRTSQREIVEPSNEIEEFLLPIWKKVMEIEDISITDDFFELGGTSLDAIRIVSRIEKAINYELSVNNIFKLPTIREIAQFIMDDMQRIMNDNSNP